VNPLASWAPLWLTAVETAIWRLVRASPEAIFRLAAQVEEWPRLLPHYRFVHVQRTLAANERTVEMAARRDLIGPLAIPLRWTAIQRLHPDEPRIEFEHVRGISRGMHVSWRFDRRGRDTLVEIRHVFGPRWPVPDVLLGAIVGEYFVNGVARRTLACLGDRAERPS
jgi:ribosome-associated toxin RatA of RatAB toxin-antitoxin module